MDLTNKKYFSISEVSEITGFPAHKLRYLEKSKTGIGVFQIRGRRYYTATDIEAIKQKFSNDDKLIQLNLFTTQIDNFDKKTKQYSDSHSRVITRIDSLISKFIKLEENIVT